MNHYGNYDDGFEEDDNGDGPTFSVSLSAHSAPIKKLIIIVAIVVATMWSLRTVILMVFVIIGPQIVTGNTQSH